MALLDRFTPAGRLLAQVTRLARAAERIADALELQGLHTPRHGGQTFRGLSRDKHPDGPDGSGVTYADPEEIARALGVEAELRALLGRDPTDEELARGLRGDVE